MAEDARTRPFFVEHRSWLLAWLVVGAWFLRPFVSQRMPLPLPGWSALLARVTVLHHLGDPAWGFGEHYARAWGPVPTVGVDLLVHGLAFVTRSVPRAGTIVLGLAVFLLPLGGYALARPLGRSGWPMLLLFPLATGWFLLAGNVPLLLGSAGALFALALACRLLARPSPGRALALALAALATALLHPVPWLLLVALVLAFAAPEAVAKRVRAPSLALAALAPSLGLFAAGWTHLRHLPQPPLERASIAATLREASKLFDLFGDRKVEEYLLAGAAALWLLYAVSDRGPAAVEGPARRRPRPLLFASLAFALLFALPPALFARAGVAHAALAALPLLAAALLLLPRGRPGRARGVLLGLAVAATLAQPWLTGKAFAQFAGRAAPILRLVLAVPRGERTIVLQGVTAWAGAVRLHDAALPVSIESWTSVTHWPLLLRGGFDPALPAAPPLAVRRALPSLADADAPAEAAPAITRLLDDWRYLVARDDLRPALPPDGLVLIARDPPWALYRSAVAGRGP